MYNIAINLLNHTSSSTHDLVNKIVFALNDTPYDRLDIFTGHPTFTESSIIKHDEKTTVYSHQIIKLSDLTGLDGTYLDDILWSSYERWSNSISMLDQIYTGVSYNFCINICDSYFVDLECHELIEYFKPLLRKNIEPNFIFAQHNYDFYTYVCDATTSVQISNFWSFTKYINVSETHNYYSKIFWSELTSYTGWLWYNWLRNQKILYRNLYDPTN